MPLSLVQVNTWHSVRPEKYKRGTGHTNYVSYGDYYLLNTNRMVDIRETTGGGTVFEYNQAPDDHRCSPDTIETNSTLLQLNQDADLVPQDKFATLDIFPTLDITRVTVDTPVETQIEWDSIALAYQTPRDVDYGVIHLVYYDKSWKRRLVIVEMDSLNRLYSLQDE